MYNYAACFDKGLSKFQDETGAIGIRSVKNDVTSHSSGYGSSYGKSDACTLVVFV